MDLIEYLQTPHSYVQALEHLQSQRKKPHQRYKVVYGNLVADDIFLHKLAYAKKIATTIKQQRYAYHPLLPTVIKQKDKKRIIYPHFISDHIIQSIIQRYLTTKIEPLLSDALMSYRKGFSAQQARYHLSQYLKKHTYTEDDAEKINLYVVQTDLQNYTDTIPIGDNQPLWKLLSAFKEDDYSWQLIRSSLQATYCENNVMHCKLFGIPMGSPLTSLVANLYLNTLDHELSKIADGLYLRFGDDIIFCHPNPKKVTDAMTHIESHTHALGLIINPEKTKYTYLTRAGRPSSNSIFKGSSVLHYLGYAVHANSETSLKPQKETDIINLIRKKIHISGKLMQDLSVDEKGIALCNMLNHSFLNSSITDTSFFLEGISTMTHRGLLKRLDFHIALEVAKYLTHNKSVKAFRKIPYKMIRNQYGLLSLCQLKNQIDRHGTN